MLRLELLILLGLCLGVLCQEYDFGAEIARQCRVPDPVGLLDCVENKVTLPYLTSWVDCTNSLGENVKTSTDIINYRCKSVWEGKAVIPEVFYIKDCVIEKTGLPAKNVSAEVLGAYKECENNPQPQNQRSSTKTAPVQQQILETTGFQQPPLSRPPPQTPVRPSPLYASPNPALLPFATQNPAPLPFAPQNPVPFHYTPQGPAPLPFAPQGYASQGPILQPFLPQGPFPYAAPQGPAPFIPQGAYYPQPYQTQIPRQPYSQQFFAIYPPVAQFPVNQFNQQNSAKPLQGAYAPQQQTLGAFPQYPVSQQGAFTQQRISSPSQQRPFTQQQVTGSGFTQQQKVPSPFVPQQSSVKTAQTQSSVSYAAQNQGFGSLASGSAPYYYSVEVNHPIRES